MAFLPLPACPPLVLSFAHSDPTTGGGLQADLLTLVSLGTHPLTVTTAVSVQDTAGISNTLVLDAEWVEDQARALLEDVQIDAFKVGLLGGTEMVSTVAEILADYSDVQLVLYPSPTRLLADVALEDEVFAALRDLLLPQTTLLVVDIADAPRLMGEFEDDEDDVAAAATAGAGRDEARLAATAAALLADRILETGCAAVLLTGVGDGAGERNNLLFADGGLRLTQRWESLPGNFHGAGETLASALAGCLACGEELLEAVRNAHEYTAQALAAGFRPGMGRILPDRFFWARSTEASAEPTGAGDHAV